VPSLSVTTVLVTIRDRVPLPGTAAESRRSGRPGPVGGPGGGRRDTLGAAGTRTGPRQVRPPGAWNDAAVTTATYEGSRAHSLTRPNMVSVGTIIWLSSELMFFAGLFAMYFTVRAAHPGDWPMEPTELDVPYALGVTIPLVLSSVTCQIGVFKAEAGDVFGFRRWYVFTFALGLLFVLGQANEYRNLVHEGTTLSATGYGSVFFITTGFHGLHVIGGLLAFIFVLIRSTMGRFTPAQATAAIVVSYYWHFVDIVWIGLFATIYLIQ
jgi:cytochrome c oxidase subunit III